MLLLGWPGRCCFQNRVHCEHMPASSSARLQCLAQMPVAEPLINFTKGGLAEFPCVLSTPGCLTTGFRSLGAWVCAARDTKERGIKNTEINDIVCGNQDGKFSPVSATGLGAVRTGMSRLPAKKKSMRNVPAVDIEEHYRTWEFMKTSWC